MPVYEYQCQACGRDFEYQQRMSDPDKTTCEACGGTLDRLISRTAFSLKGGGWYKDLYASPKPESAGKADKPNAAADGGKSDGAAAPAAKSDAGDRKLAATTTQAELEVLIEQLNGDPVVDGILVQLRLPPPLDADAVIRALDPAKDVDGLHPMSLGLLAQGRPSFVPCTPSGC